MIKSSFLLITFFGLNHQLAREILPTVNVPCTMKPSSLSCISGAAHRPISTVLWLYLAANMFVRMLKILPHYSSLTRFLNSNVFSLLLLTHEIKERFFFFFPPTVIFRLGGWYVETGGHLSASVPNCLCPYLFWSFRGLLTCQSERKLFADYNYIKIWFLHFAVLRQMTNSDGCMWFSNPGLLGSLQCTQKVVSMNLFCLSGFLI